MGDSAEYMVLAEDLQAQVFICRTLVSLGVEPRRIRRLPLPAGSGAGEQYVRVRYPAEVDSLRRRAAAKALLVHIDADPKSTVIGRHLELAAALNAAALPPRGANEPVVELVAKRNIETWLHCLAGTTVNEQDAYPKFAGREGACGIQAALFATHTRAQTSPLPTTPSLQDGLLEMRRLL